MFVFPFDTYLGILLLTLWIACLMNPQSSSSESSTCRSSSPNPLAFALFRTHFILAFKRSSAFRMFVFPFDTYLGILLLTLWIACLMNPQSSSSVSSTCRSSSPNPLAFALFRAHFILAFTESSAFRMLVLPFDTYLGILLLTLWIACLMNPQ